MFQRSSSRRKTRTSPRASASRPERSSIGKLSAPTNSLSASAPRRSTKCCNRPADGARAQEIIQIETAEIDCLPGLSSDAKKQRLSRVSGGVPARPRQRRSGGVQVLSRAHHGAGNSGKTYTDSVVPNVDLISMQQIGAK